MQLIIRALSLFLLVIWSTLLYSMTVESDIISKVKGHKPNLDSLPAELHVYIQQYVLESIFADAQQSSAALDYTINTICQTYYNSNSFRKFIHNQPVGNLINKIIDRSFDLVTKQNMTEVDIAILLATNPRPLYPAISWLNQHVRYNRLNARNIFTKFYQHKNFDGMQALLKAGLNKKLLKPDNTNLLQIALDCDSDSFLDYLLRRYPDEDSTSCFIAAVKKDRANHARTLLHAKTYEQHIMNLGLKLAKAYGHTKIICMLTQEEAEIIHKEECVEALVIELFDSIHTYDFDTSKAIAQKLNIALDAYTMKMMQWLQANPNSAPAKKC